MTTVIFSTWKIYLTYSGQELLLPVTAGASNDSRKSLTNYDCYKILDNRYFHSPHKITFFHFFIIILLMKLHTLFFSTPNILDSSHPFTFGPSHQVWLFWQLCHCSALLHQILLLFQLLHHLHPNSDAHLPSSLQLFMLLWSFQLEDKFLCNRKQN